ncbi:MAG: GNAT family N-acetyltransferase [Gammaproteobacteria bacterium]|nr:GNAT family N-acetyltransferase [Gammaproteobacteria bacterium]
MRLAEEFVFADKNKHNLKGFDCKKTDMNDFLSRFAIKNSKLGLSQTWVLTTEKLLIKNKASQNKLPIAAYYTLASSTVSREDIPLDINLPAYPVPIVLLARLAVDKNFQRSGLGGKTLVTALRKSIELTDRGLPAVGLILDVLDEEALKFYQHFEIFKSFTDEPMRLFAPMSVLRLL